MSSRVTKYATGFVKLAIFTVFPTTLFADSANLADIKVYTCRISYYGENSPDKDLKTVHVQVVDTNAKNALLQALGKDSSARILNDESASIVKTKENQLLIRREVGFLGLQKQNTTRILSGLCKESKQTEFDNRSAQLPFRDIPYDALKYDFSLTDK